MSGQSRRGRATPGLVGALLGGLLAVLPGTVVTGSPGRPAEAATARVEVGDLRFSPAKLQISVGDTVEWDAADDGHTVTARDGSFDSSSRGLMGTGDYFRFRFRAPGTFAYYCRVHASRGMQGEIVVVDPSAPTATTRLTPVSAAATTSTTSSAAAVTTTTAPVTTTSRVLATSSTTSLAQAVATTSPPGSAATPNEAPTMNPDARVVGSPPPEAGGLPEAQAAARHRGGSGPAKGPLIGAAAALLALLALGAFGLKRRRRTS